MGLFFASDISWPVRRKGRCLLPGSPEMPAYRALFERGKLCGEGFQFLIGQVLEIEQMIARSVRGADQFVELEMHGLGITVLGALDEKTMMKVTMVVLGLMTSCQVSE